MRTHRRLAGALLAAILVAAGCGGTTDSSAPTSSTAESSSTAVSSTTADVTTTTAATTTTTTTAAPPSTDSPPPGLRSLVPGHNDVDGDRINLVFAPWGWDDPDRFATLAEAFLGWDGTAVLADADGWPTDQDDAVWAELGLFGVEPFRSNRNKFNVWITDISPPGPALWLNDTEVAPFDLPDLAVVTLALDPWREVPGINSVAGQDQSFLFNQPEPERSGPDSVANAMVAVDGFHPMGRILDLPHELGHALFGLADEYVGRLGGDDAPPRPDFWPSCAASRETAEAWWGDLVGQYDPMIDLWAEELSAAGFPPPADDVADRRALLTVGYVDGGCHGDPGSVRAADDTLMGFNQPAFGLTNRRHAERILALWTG